ncbi:hypothetical protein N7533_003491 [Penicillium manginii]|uniref:uncharacterized protein n=1 Tax=Penicillium manginii TaxID=203109 RepID=UPI00254769EC|nr:uncharacterized protein N7533_003491 [Penicillium manginii]KAJ5761452.1 hypothetical protein N7533_003491 [Penicillium manginii]
MPAAQVEECELDFDTDGRRRVVFKRKIHSLEQDRNLLLQLMETIRSDDNRTAPGVLNLIRSNASFYSWYPEGFANPDEQSSRGEHFFKEATRLLAEEQGRLTLTTLQARGDIYTSVCVMGKDRLGWQYLVEIADCARQFINKREIFLKEANDEVEEVSRSIDTTLHGLFSLNPFATLSFQKPTIIKRPQLKYSPQDHRPSDDWTPYPRQADPQPAHTNCVKNGLFDLSNILWEVSEYLFGDEKPATPDTTKIDAFYERLQNWAKCLPSCIDKESNATPGVMDIHMRYHNAILIMYGFILPALDETQSTEKARINAICTSSAREIGDGLNKFRSLWPVEYMPMNLMQYATMALFALLGSLEHEEERKSFTDILISLRALARRWQLAKGMLRLIQLTAMKQEAKLPAEAQILLRDFEEELWSASDRQRFSSLYPNFAVSTEFKEGMGAAADDAELDRLLDEWDNLTLSKKVPTIKEEEGKSDEQSK